MRVPAAVLTALVSCVVLPLLSQPAFAGPIIVEETARLSPPSANLPLNGPIALYGNTMAVASIVADLANARFICTVLVYERPTATGAWSFTRTLTQLQIPDDRTESFLALDAADGAIAVSARGYASVFERAGADWVEKPLVRQPGADVASDIAVSGDLAVVGGTDSNASGYVYSKAPDGQWPFATQLRAGPRAVSDNDYIGENVDINGNFVAIVSPDPDDDLPNELQRLYVFRRTDAGQWLQVATLQDPEAPESPRVDAPVSVVTLTGGLGLAAFRNQAGGISLFHEQSRDAWAPLDNVRPVDMLMNRTVQSGFAFFSWFAPLELNRVPGPAAVAVGIPDDDDRGAAAGSVDVFAPESGLASWRHVVEFVASDAQPNHKLGSFAAFHNNTVAAVGGNRVYVFTMPTSFTQPSLVHDDFEDGDAAGWRQTSTSWSVISSRGSRVYRQGSTSGEHVATRTGIDWRDVAIEADVRPTAFNGSDRWVSLMARHIDDQNYYYVALRNTNVLRLAKRVGNTFTTLASTSLPVTVNRSYRVRLEAVGTWLRVYIDGRLRLQARDSTIRHGSVGMKTAFAQAEFDNVLVSPNPLTTLLADDFELSTPFPWVTEPAANWSEVDIGSNIVLRQGSASGTSRATIGVEYDSAEPELANHVVEARVRALSFGSTDARFGLMARVRDNGNYTSVVLNRNGTIALRKNTNGSVQVLDSAALAVTAGTWYTLRLETVDDRLRVYVNNSLMLEARDASIDATSTRARYGLLTVGTVAEYDEVRVTEP